MNHNDYAALIAMRKYGGSFASHLASAWMVADSTNSARLKDAFGDLLEQYRAMTQQVAA